MCISNSLTTSFGSSNGVYTISDCRKLQSEYNTGFPAWLSPRKFKTLGVWCPMKPCGNPREGIIVITTVSTWESSMVALKLRKVGNSVGVILPRATLDALHVDEGDTVFLTSSVEGF